MNALIFQDVMKKGRFSPEISPRSLSSGSRVRFFNAALFRDVSFQIMLGHVHHADT